MTKKQQALYDKTCAAIHKHFGSYNAIAIQAHAATGDSITSETVRVWFVERRIPAEFVFVLYEMMNGSFDLFALLPWLKRWVVLKSFNSN